MHSPKNAKSMNLNNIHTPHVVVAGYCLAHLLFLIVSKNFIQEALREKGLASSMRLTGFMFANTICFGFMWDCIWHGLDKDKLLYMLVSMAALYGIIKAAQVLEFKNGRPSQQVPPQPPPQNNTNETL